MCKIFIPKIGSFDKHQLPQKLVELTNLFINNVSAHNCMNCLNANGQNINLYKCSFNYDKSYLESILHSEIIIIIHNFIPLCFATQIITDLQCIRSFDLYTSQKPNNNIFIYRVYIDDNHNNTMFVNKFLNSTMRQIFDNIELENISLKTTLINNSELLTIINKDINQYISIKNSKNRAKKTTFTFKKTMMGLIGRR